MRASARLVPLSVATDRIGLTAMRAATLQARLAQQGLNVDRSGTGLIVEVYPAAGLKLWALPHNKYKSRVHLKNLSVLVDDLVKAAPWLDLAEHEVTCRLSDHAFDAVIAALIARAAACGLTQIPQLEDHAAAAKEGWIALPTRQLRDLL